MTNYATTEYATKKALKEAVAAGERIGVERQSIFNPGRVESGTTDVCGPHYPKPHKWYAQVTVIDGIIVSVR